VTRVLATGFEPFDGSSVNPSEEIVEALDGEVATALLPVSYARAAAELRGAVRASSPDVVICFGQADGRTEISIERFAHNLDEAVKTDNDGAAGSGTAIDPGGPAAYPATLPVDELVAALRAEAIPAAPSRDAGGYLCNHVFYVLMGLLEAERPQALGGFVHVPPDLPFETLVGAARVIVTTCAQLRSAS
jgi:pyroglutamyl-peptidase